MNRNRERQRKEEWREGGWERGRNRLREWDGEGVREIEREGDRDG